MTVSDLQDQCRQPMQVIMSAVDNIKMRLKQLGIEDEIIDEAQAAVDRNIERLDNELTNGFKGITNN